jgi:DNA primase small subunit
VLVWRDANNSSHPDKEVNLGLLFILSLTISIQAILNSVIMHYMLPRIDSHVSIQLNHLLKLPFCIHPDTGKICVPVNSEIVENFDPNAVPNLLELIQEKRLNGRVDIGLETFRNFYKL